MVISHTQRFIFVHIDKTAGSSMTRVLAPYAHETNAVWLNQVLEKLGIRVNYFGPTTWRRFRVHSSAANLRRHLPARIFNAYFKFAFVRNPWDRMVSRYEFLMARPKHRHHKWVSRLGGFTNYLHAVLPGHSLHQHRMVMDARGDLLVDFVGRFENLAADFQSVCDQLGLQATLPHVGRTGHRDYRSYYTTATQQFVADHFRQDLGWLGYQFDGSPVSYAA